MKCQRLSRASYAAIWLYTYQEETYEEETTEYVEEDSNGDEFVEEETTETYEEEEVYED